MLALQQAYEVCEVILIGIGTGSVPERQRHRWHHYIPTDDGSCADLEWRAGSEHAQGNLDAKQHRPTRKLNLTKASFYASLLRTKKSFL